MALYAFGGDLGRFLSLWDVVAAFANPLDLGPLHFTRTNLGFELRKAEILPFDRRRWPARGNDLGARVELDALHSVDVGVAE